MTWDPEKYLAFGEERTRAASELLARVAARSPRRIADLGCGPGNSTALLAARWPDAEIDAIDTSAAMLARARELEIAARWTVADIASWSPRRCYDIIYANAALHWVRCHETLLPRLFSFLEPCGLLAFQVPHNFAEPSHKIVQALAAEPEWADKLSRAPGESGALSPAAYYDILEPIADDIEIWETEYLQRLTSPDAVCEWVRGTALRPYCDALNDEERDAFVAEYRTRAARAYPRRATGITLFPFRRVFCVAKRGLV